MAAGRVLAVSLLSLMGALAPSVALGQGNTVVHSPQSTGLSASRPGISAERSLPFTKNGVGGVTARRDLVSGEGLGKGWCQDNGGYVLGAHFRHVYACGPANGASDAFDTAGFQCVELSVRFLWAVYGDLVTDVPDGKDLVRIAHEQLGIKQSWPGPGSLPAPGDVVSLWGGPRALAYGHTAVVTGVNVDSTGDGTVTVMEQNGTANGWDQINVTDWSETYGSSTYGRGIFYYNHVTWLDLAPSGWNPASPNFRVRSLGTGTEAQGLNDQGGLTGSVQVQGAQEEVPFVYSAGQLHVLAAPGPQTQAIHTAGINDYGAVTAWGGSQRRSAYAIGTRGTLTWRRLPLPSRVMAVQTTTLDDWGDVGGWVSTSSNKLPSLGMEWLHEAGSYVPRLLAANRLFDRPTISAVDHFGDAVGSEALRQRRFATVWTPWDRAYRLPPLSTNPEGRSSYAVAVAMTVHTSRAGRMLTVLGSSRNWLGVLQACLWHVLITPSRIHWGLPTPIPLPHGFNWSWGVGLNATGSVVGDMGRRGFRSHGFLWRPAVGTVDLDSLLKRPSPWIVTGVAGINRWGAIAAHGYITGDLQSSQALLLRPGV